MRRAQIAVVELRFDVEIGGGTFADLRARVFPDAVTEPAT